MMSEKLDKDGDLIINSPEHLAKVLKKRRADASQHKVNDKCINNSTPKFEHTEVANLFCKVVRMLPLDNKIKYILTSRMMSPLIKKKAKSHMSLAIELGFLENEIIEMEAYGVEMLNDHLKKHSAGDFIQKFNRDRTVQKEVNKLKHKMGKSN